MGIRIEKWPCNIEGEIKDWCNRLGLRNRRHRSRPKNGNSANPRTLFMPGGCKQTAKSVYKKISYRSLGCDGPQSKGRIYSARHGNLRLSPRATPRDDVTDIFRPGKAASPQYVESYFRYLPPYFLSRRIFKLL